MPESVRSIKRALDPQESPRDGSEQEKKPVQIVRILSEMKGRCAHIQNEATRIDMEYRLQACMDHPADERGVRALWDDLSVLPQPIHYVKQPDRDISWGAFFLRANDLFGNEAERALRAGKKEHLDALLVQQLTSDPRSARSVLRDWKNERLRLDLESMTPEVRRAIIEECCDEYKKYEEAVDALRDNFMYQSDLRLIQELRDQLSPRLEQAM